MLTKINNLYIEKYDYNYVYNSKIKESLSVEEKYKYDRYKYDDDKNKFLQRHITLRQILLSNNIGESIVSYNNFGQPILQNIQSNKNSWNISLSSSTNFFTIFISNSKHIGVDIEFIKKIDISDSLINLVLHPNEKTLYYNMPPHLRINYFYKLWTEKESYVKSIGIGLLLDLRNIELEKIKEKYFLRNFLFENHLISYCILDIKN